MWTRRQLKEGAKAALHRSYWAVVLVSFIVSIISGSSGSSGGGNSSSDSMGSTSGGGFGDMDWGVLMGVIAVIGVVLLVVIVVGIALSLFVFNPLKVGGHRFFIEATHEQKRVGDISLMGTAFSRGKSAYLNVVKIMFFKGLYQGLWTLLLIVPGIIKMYEYRMIPYILAENPDIDMKDAFLYSKEMMDNQKWDAFVLDLSFMGWNMLSVFTCGILSIFYVNPYINLTNAELYEFLKHRASGDYFDPTIGRDAYVYGNPGAYSADVTPGSYGSDVYTGATYTDVTYTGGGDSNASMGSSDLSGGPITEEEMNYYKPDDTDYYKPADTDVE